MSRNVPRLLSVAILVFACSFAGCSKKEEPASQQSSTPPVPAPSAPQEARDGNSAKGKEIFATSCASCHGNGGKGDGVAAAALNPKPRDLTDTLYLSKLKDDYLYDVIAKGGDAFGKSPLMPPFGASLKEQDIRDVVAFIRSLAK